MQQGMAMPELLHLPNPTSGLRQYDLQGKTDGECVLSYIAKLILKTINSFFPKMNNQKNLQSDEL